jgi:hypothetical protein
MPTKLDLSEYSPQRPQIAKVSYTHDAMIDLIMANPAISQGALAAHFGYTESWISTVFASEAFQVRLAERKEDIIDPGIRATIEERFKALVYQSMEVLQRKLESPAASDELALATLTVASKALGYGIQKDRLQVSQQFVVQLPPRATSAEAWLEEARPQKEISET